MSILWRRSLGRVGIRRSGGAGLGGRRRRIRPPSRMSPSPSSLLPTAHEPDSVPSSAFTLLCSASTSHQALLVAGPPRGRIRRSVPAPDLPLVSCSRGSSKLLRRYRSPCRWQPSRDPLLSRTGPSSGRRERFVALVARLRVGDGQKAVGGVDVVRQIGKGISTSVVWLRHGRVTSSGGRPAAKGSFRGTRRPNPRKRWLAGTSELRKMRCRVASVFLYQYMCVSTCTISKTESVNRRRKFGGQECKRGGTYVRGLRSEI